MTGGERAFKKAFQARTHKERSQPAARASLGLLEKHKDYVQRARNYHRKQKQLKALKIQASAKNPDEFYFGMIKSRVQDGQHVKDATEQTKSIPASMLKLMKTQDVSYISLQKNANRKKLKRLEEEVALLEVKRGTVKPSRTIFAEDPEEMQEIVQSAQQAQAAEESDPESSDKDAEGEALDLLDAIRPDPQERDYQRRVAELTARRERDQQLEKLEYKMRLDTQLLKKGRRQKIGTDEYGFAKYKWHNERKK